MMIKLALIAVLSIIIALIAVWMSKRKYEKKDRFDEEMRRRYAEELQTQPHSWSLAVRHFSDQKVIYCCDNCHEQHIVDKPWSMFDTKAHVDTLNRITPYCKPNHTE